MNNQSRRTFIILVSAVDALISGVILLIYFGFLPVDLSGLGIQHWAIGLFAGIWFLASIGVLAYQLTRTDISE
jgi:ABC-type thiamin/hydroxymethylpyrimidine transport system permease subunit